MIFGKIKITLPQNNNMKDIIAIINNKGGVAKTTTTLNVAAGLARKKKKVLVIDLDAQSNASASYGWKTSLEQQGGHTIFDSLNKPKQPIPVYLSEKGVYYSPASPKLSEIEVFLKAQMSPASVLRNALNNGVEDYSDTSLTDVKKDFDYVLLDCPPQMTTITVNAMVAATKLIIPVQPNAFSIDGLAGVINTYMEVKDNLNPELTIMGILIVMEDNRLKINRDCTEAINNAFKEMVFHTHIRRGTDIEKAQANNADIYQYAPSSKVAEDYENLVKEILKK